MKVEDIFYDMMKGEYYMKNYIYLNGDKIEISDETAQNFKEQFGEYQFKHGDIVGCGKVKRIIVQEKDSLVARTKDGNLVSRGQQQFVFHTYKKIGNVFGEE